jgi:hypothetical protein
LNIRTVFVFVIPGEDPGSSVDCRPLQWAAGSTGSRLKAGMTKNKARMTKMTIELGHLQTSQGRINKRNCRPVDFSDVRYRCIAVISKTELMRFCPA